MIAGIDGESLLADFCQAASLAGVKLSASDIVIEVLPAPHRPPSSLPPGKMAVYVFVKDGECLKVGKAGSKSQARYVGHHYSPNSSQSNLARSLLDARGAIGDPSLTESNIREWIKGNTDRINLLLPKCYDIAVLTLLEAFVQCRLRPRFEGFKSQRRKDAEGEE